MALEHVDELSLLGQTLPVPSGGSTGDVLTKTTGDGPGSTEWAAPGEGGGASAFADLTDVDTPFVDTQPFVWDEATGTVVQSQMFAGAGGTETATVDRAKGAWIAGHIQAPAPPVPARIGLGAAVDGDDYLGFPVLPLTVEEGVNDQFVYTPLGGDPETFTVAPGTYPLASDLATAIGGALGESDEPFSTYVNSDLIAGRLCFTNLTVGSAGNGAILSPGANDITVFIGFELGARTFIGGADVYSASIAATEKGAAAWGYAIGGIVRANADGATAWGYGYDQGLIEALGPGANAAGYASRGSIRAIYSGGMAWGYAGLGEIRSEGYGASAWGYAYYGSITSGGSGSQAFGDAYTGGQIRANGYGANAFGYAQEGLIFAGGSGAQAKGVAHYTSAGIRAPGYGASAWGYAYQEGAILADGYSAHAWGFAAYGGTIQAIDDAAHAWGYAYGSGPNDGSTLISAEYGGSLAWGYAYQGQIRAMAQGAAAWGYAAGTDGFIGASAYGAVAFGNANAFEINAQGNGSFAGGDATTADISAGAIGAFQWGPGINDEVNSLRVGSGPWLLPGPPGSTLTNGQIWVDGDGNVVIRSGGASVVIA